MLVDTYGRVATDLRVSLTDRCNLRCTYRMPEEGLRRPARPDLLTDGEVVRLVRIAVTELGVDEVRFTGGEPLLRPTVFKTLTRRDRHRDVLASLRTRFTLTPEPGEARGSAPAGSPTGRCLPSGADARARRGNDVHRQNWE